MQEIQITQECYNLIKRKGGVRFKSKAKKLHYGDWWMIEIDDEVMNSIESIKFPGELISDVIIKLIKNQNG